MIGNINIPGIYQTQAANPNLTWETDVTFNAGLDFSLFKGRVNVTYDHFIRTAKNLLSYLQVPFNNTNALIPANVGSTRSEGDEIDIITHNVEGRHFMWSSHITLSHYVANWVERNPQYVLQPWETKNASLNATYGLKTDGIIKTSADIPTYQTNANLGNIKYVKIDDKTNSIGATDIAKLYDNNPWRFGFGNNVKYGNWDASIFLYGTFHQYGWKYNVEGSPLTVANLGQTANQVKLHWASFNPGGDLPGIAPDPVNNSTGHTDFGLTKHGGWARIRNISLGYTLPSESLQKTKILRSIRLFVELQNVYTFSKIYKDTDPEYWFYPPAFNTSFGINIGFN